MQPSPRTPFPDPMLARPSTSHVHLPWSSTPRLCPSSQTIQNPNLSSLDPIQTYYPTPPSSTHDPKVPLPGEQHTPSATATTNAKFERLLGVVSTPNTPIMTNTHFGTRFPPPPHPYSTPSSPLFAPTCSTTPSMSYGSSTRPSIPRSSGSLKRPAGPPKKPTSSTLERRQAVQLSLESKADKARFQPIHIPLARAVPAPPPSSPVLGFPIHEYKSSPLSDEARLLHSVTVERKHEGQLNQLDGQHERNVKVVHDSYMPIDYFGTWDIEKVDEELRSSMEIDR